MALYSYTWFTHGARFPPGCARKGEASFCSVQPSFRWLPLLIAWTVNVCIPRYGGLRIYRSAMPFFLELIVGELLMGCLWGVIGIVFNVPYYNFFAR